MFNCNNLIIECYDGHSFVEPKHTQPLLNNLELENKSFGGAEVHERHFAHHSHGSQEMHSAKSHSQSCPVAATTRPPFKCIKK
jgi:hypothetical protein